jgi:hypothetical protein
LIPEDKIQQLADDIKVLLQEHDGGLSEHDMFRRLLERGHSEFSPDVIRSPKELYVSHFILFHTLYCLKHELNQQGLYLEINPVRIRLLPLRESAGSDVAQHDVMASFYLDAGNIDAMSEQQINDMLGAFWQHYFVRDDHQSALEELGLDNGVDYRAVKNRYQQLAREHHPDRGGDNARFQRINQAMDVLKKYYNK